MKNLLLTYNILFLLAGNVLFSSIHFLHDHSNLNETQECDQCTLLDNSNNFISASQQVDFYTYESKKNVLKQIVNISLFENKEHLSRAPPLS